jgi:hypothetical protein
MEREFALEGELAVENRDCSRGAGRTRRRKEYDRREESSSIGREAGICSGWR